MTLRPVLRQGTRTIPSQTTFFLRSLPQPLSSSRRIPQKQGTILQRRTLFGNHGPIPLRKTLTTLDVDGIYSRQTKNRRRKLAFLVAGFITSLICLVWTINRLHTVLIQEKVQREEQMAQKKERNAKTTGVGDTIAPSSPSPPIMNDRNKGGGDSSIKLDTLPGTTMPVGSKVVVHSPDGADLVPTGHRTVKHFPLTVYFPNADPAGPDVEYTLIGLGIRNVSFLQISVYVVGFYVATQDIAGLQERLVKKVNPLASTLIPCERETLKKMLHDPSSGGEALWVNALFPARTALRVVPVRDTNFPHLRDGFMRAIASRGDPQQARDEEFRAHLREFKNSFSRGKLASASELLIQRDPSGKLRLSYVDSKGSGRRVHMGAVDEARISAPLFLNYLSGRVASPSARESIVQGVMDFVERPMGSIAAQVI